jgi:Family of unknown function (DUF5906)
MNTVPRLTVVGSHPVLRAYLSHIGAAEKNFRKHVIEAEDSSAYIGGRRLVAEIKIEPDGTIKCDEQYAPTADEQKAIKAEIAATPFPNSINARKGSLPPQLAGIDPNHYCVFIDQHKNDEVKFIQWRRDGDKPDLPLSFWSDGIWRLMEPDGPLPLYGLDRLKDAAVVFLHEGAKGARTVQALVDDGGEALAAHPWAADLKEACHIGWPGGVERPHQVDWGPIKKLAPYIRIVVVADNDQVGIDAVTKISSILQRRMTAIIFDDRFPAGFDLADPWPKRLDWWLNERYIGPTFDECSTPATWATETVHTGEKGRPAFRVRKHFVADWLAVKEPPVFVHRNQTNKLLSDAMFNRAVRPFSDVDDTARLLLKHLSSQCDGVAYMPGRTAGVIIVDGQQLVNCYQPPSIKATKGDPTPFVDFIEHLVPEEMDRLELERWCATLMAQPDIRMTYGVLLISQVQGVGKGTLGEAILAPIVGTGNVSFPSEQEVTESAFNGWLDRKQLAVVHEIYAGHSAKAYNKLKSTITDKYVTVNVKFMPTFTIENYIQLFACSNSLRALHLDDDDRRWLVPRVTDENRPKEYWREFYAWLADGGLGIIRCWADEFLRMNEPVRRGEHAPPTSLKKEIIAEGRSEGEQMAYDLGMVVNEKGRMGEQIVLAVEDVRDWVATQRNIWRNDSKLERPMTLRKALKAAGLMEPAFKGGKDQRFQIDPARIKSHVVANFYIGPEETWPTIKEFYKKPEDLKPM